MSAAGMSGAQPTPKPAAVPLLSDEQKATVMKPLPQQFAQAPIVPKDRRVSTNVEDRRNPFSFEHNRGIDDDTEEAAQLRSDLRDKALRHRDSRRPLVAKAIGPFEAEIAGVKPGNARRRGRVPVADSDAEYYKKTAEEMLKKLGK